MAQNYEVFLADRPLLICRELVDNIDFEGYRQFGFDGPSDWSSIRRELNEDQACKGALVLAEDPKSAWRSFKREFTILKAAGGLVLDSTGRILAIHRLGKWDLPKGKREKGEGKRECAEREVMEECGLAELSVSEHIQTTWHTYEHKGRSILKRTDWYLMFASSNQPIVPQTEENIEQVTWLDAAGVAEMRTNTYVSILRVLDALVSRPTP